MNGRSNLSFTFCILIRILKVIRVFYFSMLRILKREAIGVLMIAIFFT